MEAILDATTRNVFGKNAMRQLRRAGLIPAVVYGQSPAGEKPAAHAIQVEPGRLMHLLHSESGVNTLIGLSVDGAAPTSVMVREFLLDPVTHRPLHADFYRIAMDKAMRVTVPIVVRGEPRGVKQQGGLLDFVHRDVDVECLPGDIPEHIVVDVTELLIGQSIRVKDLAPGAKWELASDAETMLVHVVPPKAEEPAPEAAAAAAAPAAPAEPEVIKKGKVEKAEAAE